MLTHRDVLRRGASAYGQRVAITGPDGRDLTYAELEAQTTRVAQALHAHQLGPGDRMLWIDQNSAEYLVAYYATAKLGMAIAPLNYWLRPNELQPLADLVDASVVVAGPGYEEIAREAVRNSNVKLWVSLDPANTGGSDWASWSDLLSGDDGALDISVGEDAIHEIIFTSGTTGQAKGVMRTQRSRILDSMNAALAYELGRNDHMLWFLPQFHVGGASVPGQLLVQGGRVTVLRKFEPKDAAKAISSGVTYIVGVPAHYNLMFESGSLEGVDTSGVTGCYVGGSVATRRVFEEILKHFPNAELVHGYGSTESGPHTMALRGKDFLDHFGALGLPVPGSEVRVVDPDGQGDVGTDEIGELWVRSDSVMTGYLNRPEITAEAVTADGWLHTGDLVRRSADGYFYIVDRVKDLIITGGENVYPKEVEDVLAAHPTVAEVAVIGVPDDIYEERVVAVVRLLADVQPPSADELISYVRERLAGFKTPKRVHFVEDFPRTGVGKIQKPSLREQFGSVFGETS